MPVTVIQKQNLPAIFLEKVAGLNQEPEHDLLLAVASHIDSLEEEQALHELRQVSEVRGFNAFYMGGLLLRTQKSGWYLTEGYTFFKDFVERSVGLARSTAYDFMRIYENLVGSKVAWNQVEHLGWTKIRLIARYLTSDNVQSWSAAAEKRNAAQLREFVKETVKQGQEKLSSQSNPLLAKIVVPAKDKTTNVSTHADTSTADVATDGHPPVQAPVDDPPLVTKEAAENTLITRSFKLYQDQDELVTAALERVQSEGAASTKSGALTLVCMSYLSC